MLFFFRATGGRGGFLTKESMDFDDGIFVGIVGIEVTGGSTIVTGISIGGDSSAFFDRALRVFFFKTTGSCFSSTTSISFFPRRLVLRGTMIVAGVAVGSSCAGC